MPNKDLMPEENLYDLFQVGPSASPEAIRAVYRRLMLLHHPDRNAGIDSEDMAQRLNNAYAVLGDPARREAYDRQLQGLPEDPESQAGPSRQHRGYDVPVPGRFPRFVWLAVAAGMVGIIAIIAVITSAGGSSGDQDVQVLAPLPTPTTAPTPRPTDVVSTPPPAPKPTEAPSASFYLNNGTTLMKNGNLVGAIEEFTNAINLFPSYGYGYQIRGNTYYQMGQFQPAVGDYAIAIQLDPTDKSIYRDRGLTYFQLKEYQMAIQDFSQAIQLDPEYAVALNLRSLSYNQLQNSEAAKSDAEEACALEPRFCSTIALVTPTATPIPTATPKPEIPISGGTNIGTEFSIFVTSSALIRSTEDFIR